MTPVFQTIHDSVTGNCFQACVASIFDLPLEAVPHFLRNRKEGDTTWTSKQWEEFQTFSAKWKRNVFWYPARFGNCPQGYYIAVGKSPRGAYNHAVVMLRGKMVHDPKRHALPAGLDGGPILVIGFSAMDNFE